VILADTSVWVDYLRRGGQDLAELLLAGEVVTHSFVIGELACGGLRDREDFLAMLSALPALPKVDEREALDFIEFHRLMGKGLGWVDVHLLASCLLGGTRLWTRDRKLAGAASDLGCAILPGR
jgi:predicted nucleic acid-binding protein